MDEKAKDKFIEELDREISWQRKWEKLNRHLNTSTILTSWLSSFLILILSFYQIQLGMDFQRWIILIIAGLSLVTVSLPVLSTTMRFQQKQEVYDQMARGYSFIRIQLVTGQISLEKAISDFGKIHRQPTEKVIRQTP